jgi:hypothetical protein
LFNNAGVSSSSGEVPTTFEQMGANAIAFSPPVRLVRLNIPLRALLPTFGRAPSHWLFKFSAASGRKVLMRSRGIATKVVQIVDYRATVVVTDPWWNFQQTESGWFFARRGPVPAACRVLAGFRTYWPDLKTQVAGLGFGR